MWVNSIDFLHYRLFLEVFFQFCLAIVTKAKKSMMKGINPFEVNQLLSFNMCGRSREKESKRSCPL